MFWYQKRFEIKAINNNNERILKIKRLVKSELEGEIKLIWKEIN